MGKHLKLSIKEFKRRPWSQIQHIDPHSNHALNILLQLVPLDVKANSCLDPFQYYVAVYTGWNSNAGKTNTPKGSLLALRGRTGARAQLTLLQVFSHWLLGKHKILSFRHSPQETKLWGGDTAVFTKFFDEVPGRASRILVRVGSPIGVQNDTQGCYSRSLGS